MDKILNDPNHAHSDLRIANGFANFLIEKRGKKHIMFVKLDIKKLFKFCRADTEDEFVRLFPRHTREGLSQENRELIHKKFKGRCNITGIKVYDEARIKSKSVNPLIRLFYFIISMLLLFIWNLHSKKECPFKRFVINLERMLKNVEVSRAN